MKNATKLFSLETFIYMVTVAITISYILLLQEDMDALFYQIQILNLVYLLFHQNTLADLIVYTIFFHEGKESNSHSCIWIL